MAKVVTKKKSKKKPPVNAKKKAPQRAAAEKKKPAPAADKINPDPAKDVAIARTQAELGAALDATARTVRNWIAEGMPIRDDGTFDIEAVRTWRLDRDSRRKSKEKEQYEVKILQERLREYELKRKVQEGLLISLEEVERGRVARILAVKQDLLAMPRAMAKVLEHLDARQIEVLLKDKIHHAIRKFSGQ